MRAPPRADSLEANPCVTIGGTGSCPAPQVEVQTYSGGSRVKEPFYVALYR